MLAGHLALAVAALFTGAAVYMNWAEPARLLLDDRALLITMEPSVQKRIRNERPRRPSSIGAMPAVPPQSCVQPMTVRAEVPSA